LKVFAFDLINRLRHKTRFIQEFRLAIGGHGPRGTSRRSQGGRETGPPKQHAAK
jgi:hypothetical protein